MTPIGFRTLWNRLNRLARPVGMAIALVTIGVAIFLGGDWFRVFGPGRLFFRHSAAALLAVLIAVYPAVAAAAVFGLVLPVGVFARSWSRTNYRAGRLGHSGVARWSLLCGTTLLGIGVAEAGAAAWLAWLHRLPAMPVRFVEQADADDVVFIVVIGESSALGVPYEDWLSVGVIVERALERVIPSCRFRVEILAEKGATLEAMQVKLAGLRRRPDALIVYCGHNELMSRFSLSNRVAHYDDELSPRWNGGSLESLAGLSPVLRLARENLEKQRVGLIPAQAFGGFESVIGRPMCTPADAELVFTDFQRRLEAIVVDCERIGCLPILIIPPGNDAFDPSQSYALPGLRAEGRRALFERLIEIRSHEARDAAGAVAAYREILADQPTHAQTHHRLARLLESAGSFAEANRHYVLARDHDGLPMRCSTRLENAYRAVAQRHDRSVVLVDGPAILKARSRHGILDYHLFHDNVHPTLKSHVALAEAVLAGLKDRAAFGWPASTRAVALEPSQVAVEFEIDATAWARVCGRTAAHYGRLAFLTSDSAERIEWRDRYSQAARRIAAGDSPDDTEIPGVGNP